MLKSKPKGKSKVTHVPELEKWLASAKNRLTKEENLRLLSVYTDKLIELNRKHRCKATYSI